MSVGCVSKPYHGCLKTTPQLLHVCRMCFRTLPWLPIDHPATPACLKDVFPNPIMVAYWPPRNSCMSLGCVSKPYHGCLKTTPQLLHVCRMCFQTLPWLPIDTPQLLHVCRDSRTNFVVKIRYVVSWYCISCIKPGLNNIQYIGGTGRTLNDRFRWSWTPRIYKKWKSITTYWSSLQPSRR